MKTVQNYCCNLFLIKDYIMAGIFSPNKGRESDQEQTIEIIVDIMENSSDQNEVVSQSPGPSSEILRKLLTFICDRIDQTGYVSHLSVTYLKTLF